jgi:hypothetical protein
MSKIDRVIQYFRNLKEEAPTMSSGNGGFGGSSSSQGPTAGFDPVIGFRKRRGGKIDGRSVAKKYKNWMKSLGLLEG